MVGGYGFRFIGGGGGLDNTFNKCSMPSHA